MLSLIHASVTTDNHSHMKRLPNDCVCHIISFCTPSMTSVCYLVCRSWYHAVDRYLCLGDNFYYVPESFQPKTEITRRFPIEELNTLRDDVRLQHTQVMCLRVTDISSNMSCLANYRSLRKLDVSTPKRSEGSTTTTPRDAGIRGLETLSALEELSLSHVKIAFSSRLKECCALRKLNLSDCYLSTICIRGLDTIPNLSEIVLSNTHIGSISRLSGCSMLRKINVSKCLSLTNDGIRGLENIPTLEELNLSNTKISSVSHLRGCCAL
eukprot:PhF_6_TR463/c5_g2_i1/m.193